jgi:hypothetical protein
MHRRTRVGLPEKGVNPLLSLLCRVFPIGDWRYFPPGEPGFYWMQEKGRVLWGKPKRVEAVNFPANNPYPRVVQMDLLHKPKAERRWLKCR